MVIQGMIYRISDGLPLAGSTDVDQRHEIKECQKYLKMISKRLPSLPDRCSLYLSGFHIHLISALQLGFLVLVDESYSSLLSFCFLDEIQREFIVNYNTERILAVKRPYAFMEFDMFLQKTKQRYNSPRNLSTKLNLSDMSIELKLRPPYVISPEDLRMYDNGVIVKPHKDSHRPFVSPWRRLQPLDWKEILIALVNLFCGALNLTRGMAVIGHGHFDPEDAGAYVYGAMFIFTAFLYAYQVYLLCYFIQWRGVLNILTVVSIGLCCWYLQHFRNTLQILFHVIVALTAAALIQRRKISEKLPGYSV